jgi:tryptophan synthase alpha chain
MSRPGDAATVRADRADAGPKVPSRGARGQDRFARCFERLRERNEAAFVPFVMAGDRGLDTTARLIDALIDAGADALEIGVPFSDPMADGPVLQRAAERALSGGVTLPAVLDLVIDLRRRSDIPVVLFGYANPFLHFGAERLAEAAAQAGVDAILAVDVPPEEAGEMLRALRARALHMIFLLAPTSTPERIDAVLRVAGGFVYFVSVAGVTGVKSVTPTAIKSLVETIRARTTLPVGVGFGITTPEQAANVAAIADAVIVGTSLGRVVEEAPDPATAVERVGERARELKQATRRAAGRAVADSTGPAPSA